MPSFYYYSTQVHQSEIGAAEALTTAASTTAAFHDFNGVLRKKNREEINDSKIPP